MVHDLSLGVYFAVLGAASALSLWGFQDEHPIKAGLDGVQRPSHLFGDEAGRGGHFGPSLELGLVLVLGQISLGLITTETGLQQLHLGQVPWEINQDPALSSHRPNRLELLFQSVKIIAFTPFSSGFRPFFRRFRISLSILELSQLLYKLLLPRDARLKVSLRNRQILALIL